MPIGKTVRCECRICFALLFFVLLIH
jgi:hypothetical protein